MAVIDSAIWDADPKAAAAEIEKIRALFDLEKRIEELEAGLRQVAFSRHRIGGDLQRMKKIISALVMALNKRTAWCLKKGDLIVDTAIKWAIPAGGTGYLTLNPDKLEAVTEATKKLLSLL